MHIIGIRKFSCIYRIVKEVDFFQLKRSYNPFGLPATEAAGAEESAVTTCGSPMRGSFSEVGGMLSPITIRKTVMESSVVMPSVTFSPLSDGM